MGMCRMMASVPRLVQRMGLCPPNGAEPHGAPVGLFVGGLYSAVQEMVI